MVFKRYFSNEIKNEHIAKQSDIKGILDFLWNINLTFDCLTVRSTDLHNMNEPSGFEYFHCSYIIEL